MTRRELLAVVTFTQQYRHYLVCRRFTLRTDHGSLAWLQNFKEPEGQLARWLERLQELAFEIVHRRGTAHGNADSLSRLPCHQCGRTSHDTTTCVEVAVAALQFPPSQASTRLSWLTQHWLLSCKGRKLDPNLAQTHSTPPARLPAGFFKSGTS